MTFAQADNLFEMICQGLIESGGPYKEPLSVRTQENILIALAHGNFVIKIRSWQVRWFAAFWRVAPRDIDKVRQRTAEIDRMNGTAIYVCEAMNKDGIKGMTEIRKAIRKKAGDAKGVFWHRPVKQDKVFNFPRQKGDSYHG